MTKFVAHEKEDGTCALFERKVIVTLSTKLWDTIGNIVQLALTNCSGVSTLSIIETVIGYEGIPIYYGAQLLNAARPLAYKALGQSVPIPSEEVTVQYNKEKNLYELVKDTPIAVISAQLWSVLRNIVQMHTTSVGATKSCLDTTVASVLSYELGGPYGYVDAFILEANLKTR